MEKHTLHGTIGPNFERPPKGLIEQLARHDTTKIADSMGAYGVARHEIKPLRPQMRLCGPAVTVLTRPGDALYVQKVIEFTQPGDIVVIDAGGYGRSRASAASNTRSRLMPRRYLRPAALKNSADADPSSLGTCV